MMTTTGGHYTSAGDDGCDYDDLPHTKKKWLATIEWHKYISCLCVNEGKYRVSSLFLFHSVETSLNTAMASFTAW